jgi:hypothetical protein
MVKLLGLRYHIMYKRGPDNRAADALSRCPSPAIGELAAVSVCLPIWLEEVQQGNQDDPQAQKLMGQLTVEPPEGPKDFTFTEGILRVQGRIWVGCNEGLHRKILLAFHTGALGSHSGFNVTYRRVRALFA